MKYYIITSIILLAVFVLVSLKLIPDKLSDKSAYTYKTHTAGKSEMIRLPSETSINIDMTKEQAMSLISNPRANIPRQMAKEMMEYFSRKNHKDFSLEPE